jgi:Tol biopolymer transport system component
LPDGRLLAYWTSAADDPERTELCVQGHDGKGAVTRFKLPKKIGYISFCWAPDSRELHVSTGTPGLKGVQHLRASLKTKKLTSLDLLKTHLVTDWTPDGKYFLTTEVGNGAEWMPQSLHLMKQDGTEHDALTGPRDTALMARLSPDGKRLLCMSNNKLCVLTIGKPGSPTPLQGIAENVTVVDYAWSPDGKRIAYTTGTTRILKPEELRKVESRLIVADPDGKNPKVLRSIKGQLIGRVHWR